MPPTIKQYSDKLQQIWKRLSLAMKVAVGAGLGAVLVLAAVSAGTPEHVDYAYLYTGLDPSDAGDIIAKLKEQHTPYKLDADGTAILVPGDKVFEARLELAQGGLPRGGGVGFEIFDRNNLGQSEFVQQKNFLRALQGELERTIGSLASVSKARVHLVIPERHLFRENQDPATASVVLKLRSGRTLSDGQVQGIVHMVASSVSGLSPDHVTLLDDSGQVLSRGEDGSSGVASSDLDYKRRLERQYEQKIRTMLEHAVGLGAVSVQVSAQTDFSQVERTEETYDQEKVALRSEQISDDHNNSASNAMGGGIPGSRSNLPGGAAPQQASSQPANAGSAHHNETKNYEVGKVVSHTVAEPARLERLNAAVLVDGTYTTENGVRKFTARSSEEMDSLLAVIRQAMGFDARRGDQVELRCVPFVNDHENEVDVAPPSLVEKYKPYVLPVGLTSIFVCLAALVLMVFVRGRGAHDQPPSIVPSLPRSLKDLEPMLGYGPPNPTTHVTMASAPMPIAIAPNNGLPPGISDVVMQDANRAVGVLRSWLQDEGKALKSGDKS